MLVVSWPATRNVITFRYTKRAHEVHRQSCAPHTHTRMRPFFPPSHSLNLTLHISSHLFSPPDIAAIKCTRVKTRDSGTMKHAKRVACLVGHFFCCEVVFADVARSEHDIQQIVRLVGGGRPGRRLGLCSGRLQLFHSCGHDLLNDAPNDRDLRQMKHDCAQTHTHPHLQ